MNPHGSKTKRSILNAGRALRALPGLFLALLLAAPAQAQVVDANADVTINLQFPSEWTLPATGAWLTGTSFFTAGILNGTQFVPMSTSGAATYNIFDPNPPQTFKFYALGSAPDTDVDVWQFGGTVNTTAGSFPTVALPPGSTIPTLPPSSALITVTNDLTQGFEPYHVTGPIVAWPGGPAIQIGTYDILVSPGPDLYQQGLTGSYYERATSGQGLEIEVYADPTSGTGSAFASWFTYDTVAGGADAQRWYTAQGPVVTGQPTASLTIYQNTDGNFNAPPITNAQPVGTATLSFDTCVSGNFSYSFSDGTGRMGTIPLTRLTQNVTCSTTTPYPTNADFALSGNWFDRTTSGQGFTVEVNPNSGQLFAAWYTYMPNGTAAGPAGQRWYTAQGPFTPGMRSIPVIIYQTTGGIFNTPTPPGQTTVMVGTGTMAFQSCTAATFSYTFSGGTSAGLSGTIPLVRVGQTPPGCT